MLTINDMCCFRYYLRRTRNSRDRRSEPPPGGIGRMGFKKRVSYEECLWASGKVKKERVCY